MDSLHTAKYIHTHVHVHDLTMGIVGGHSLGEIYDNMLFIISSKIRYVGIPKYEDHYAESV